MNRKDGKGEEGEVAAAAAVGPARVTVQREDEKLL